MSTIFPQRVAVLCFVAVQTVLGSCTPASPPPYTLVAQVASAADEGEIIAAVIDVHGGGCNARVVTLLSPKAWIPGCRVIKDQDAYKSFEIAGRSVDLGEVNGSFRILGGTLPVIPVAAGTRAVAVTSADRPVFPDTWELRPYPGRLKLQGQNTGFMVTNALLTINGSVGMLAVTYKTAYAPLHLSCTVTTDQNGDFQLAFDPGALVQIAGRGTYTVDLMSEGQNITGTAWDSSAFAQWQPAMPLRWVRVSD